MNKILTIAAACAAFVACNKEETSSSICFEKGQLVTIRVSADTPSTKVTSELNADKTVGFKWAAGDRVKVTVGTESKNFIIVSGQGTASATFMGVMPDSGSSFDIQYPASDPTITTQVWSDSEALPHGVMKLTATGCTLESSNLSLTACNSALRLNLYGEDQTVSQIVVTNTTSTDDPQPAYTLNITGGVTLPTAEADAQAFFVVVPAGSYDFKVELFDNAAEPASICKFATSAEKTFTAGQVLNMATKLVEKDLSLPGDFSVSESTKVKFSPGNLYYDGSAFRFESSQLEYHSSASAPIGLFRWAAKSSSLSNDISSAISTATYLSGATTDVIFTNATETTPRTDFSVEGQASGKWRTLSHSEWYYLLDTRSVNGGTGLGKTYLLATVDGVYGMIIYPDGYSSQSSTTSYSLEEWTAMEKAGCVFLPGAGYRTGSALSTGSGLYYSSTPSSTRLDAACFLNFFSNSVIHDHEKSRYYGRSLRLVCAAL